MKTILQSIRILIVFTLLTGVVYQLAVTAISRIAFSHQADGSLVMRDDKIIGSDLLAQKFESPRYFWPRPSAADYATVASGASNKGPTSSDLAKSVEERRAKFGDTAPGDLLTASGSGLDPHISPESAWMQASLVAFARSLSENQVSELVQKFVEPPQFGVLGEPRVNVLALNLALDALK
jgi:K+-transporting ATPase ATPase C chain